MIGILFGVLKKIWWIVPILLLGLVIWWQKGVETRLRGQVAGDEAAISLYAGKIELQNQQVVSLEAAGKAAKVQAERVVVVREKAASRVVVKWRTQLVPVTVPTDCAGAVAAGATNAAQIGRLFMGSGK